MKVYVVSFAPFPEGRGGVHGHRWSFSHDEAQRTYTQHRDEAMKGGDHEVWLHEVEIPDNFVAVIQAAVQAHLETLDLESEDEGRLASYTPSTKPYSWRYTSTSKDVGQILDPHNRVIMHMYNMYKSPAVGDLGEALDNITRHLNNGGKLDGL